MPESRSAVPALSPALSPGASPVSSPGSSPASNPAPTRSVALVTLGCARNEVDSEELAGRLLDAGWHLVDDAAEADVAVVNTCGFIEQAKKDSIDVLLEAASVRDDGASRTRAVVAVGCLAERYGSELAEQLPEADAVLGFDSYASLASELEQILHGHRPTSHTPRDRRTVLPLAPAERAGHRSPGGTTEVASPTSPAVPDLADVAPVSGPRVVRARLDGRPWAPLKLASGCDRRCAFCAIPAFRGAFVSRPPAEVLAEARWLAERGVREVFLVSENSTSYGKDLGDLRLLDGLLPELASIEGIDRVRVSYLQPAELRPSLLDAIAHTEGVVPYYDLSFQHAAPALLRRMRRFGGTEDFLQLIERIRAVRPDAGIRSNVILGFPGESESDVAELASFLQAARLDVVGVFGFSPEDGTESATMDGQLDPEEIEERVRYITDLAEDLMAQRAEDRHGEQVVVLVEDIEDGVLVGRAAHQGPEVDGLTRLLLRDGSAAAGPDDVRASLSGVGALVTAKVWGSEGVDLLAEPVTGTPLAPQQDTDGAQGRA